MNMASTTASRWAVSTRTRGEVQVAGVSVPALELVLLGVSAGTSPAETEGWMRDLAGVALETSRDDTRVRAIPPLLHHALTGLLFSHAELWAQPGERGPCSVAFVDSADGAAFGWVGDARVQVIVDGGEFEPQWVIVRDLDGRSARAAVLPGDRGALLGIEFWPQGEDGSEAPVAIEAEWLAGDVVRAISNPASAEAPVALAHGEAPAESAAAVGAAPPAALAPDVSLPQQQPGLAPPPHEPHAGEGASAHGRQLPGDTVADDVAAASGSGTMLMDEVPDGPALAPEVVEAAEALSPPRTQHPVGRWLGRLLEFARRAPRRGGHHEGEEYAPVSAYDSLLSQSVPPTLVEPAEQTTLELPPIPAPMLVEPDAPSFAFAEPGGESGHGAEVVSGPALDATPASGEAQAPAALASAEPEAPGAREPELPAPVAAQATLPQEQVPVAPPVPAAMPAVSAGPSESRADVMRAMHDADVSSLPVLPSPPVREASAVEPPLLIEREPVGADAAFAIPRVPVRPAAPSGPPVLRVTTTPRSPGTAAASDASAALPLESAAHRLEPIAPAVVRVHLLSEVPGAPPMLRVGATPRGTDAPPMLRVAPSPVPPPTIVPTPPVAPFTVDAPSFAPPAISRPAWPVLDDSPVARRIPKRAWVWGGIVAAVFAAGWLVGVVTNPTDKGEPGPLTRMLRTVGLGAPHYVATVNSTPAGAWIAVDGRDVSRRTPAVVELSPGTHAITLSLPELGSAQVQVRGAGGEKVTVSPSLNGGLEVYSSDARVPIAVTLDGREVGYAPVRLESVAPGLHELQFTGPGMPAWAQTVQVGVHRTAQVVAHPMSAPANGVVQVQATLNDERGASPLSGAQVWVDGQLHGTAPASLELPRGPHSLKLTWHGETAPVQVIDLPGGNRRFASFAFGLDAPTPQVVLLGGVHPSSAGEQVVLSATLTTLQVGDVREAWLHVSTPEGLWRRYPMTAMRGARGPVLVCVFPPSSLAGGSARWYVSASTMQGDEYFSEMQVASVGGAASRPRRRKPAPATP